MEDLGDEDAKAVEKGALRRSELLFQLTRDSLRNGKRVRRYIVISHGRKRFGLADRPALYPVADEPPSQVWSYLATYVSTVTLPSTQSL